MKCVQCGSENSANAKFCRGCGGKLEAQVIVPVPTTDGFVKCSKCGHANAVGKKFCPKCGASLSAAAPIPATPTLTQSSASPEPAKAHTAASPQPDTVAIKLPPTRGGLSNAVVGGVIAATLLATAGGGGYWYYQKQKTGSANAQVSNTTPVTGSLPNLLSSADEDAALLIPDFTKPIVLRIGIDGFLQAQKLKALNGVDNYNNLAPGSNLDPAARSLDFVPCETQGTNQFSTRVSRLGVYVVDYNLDPRAFDSWLSNVRLLENATIDIRYPWAEANNARYPGQQVRTVNSFVCPIINENISKYLSPDQATNLHNGLDIAIGRRVLTKWTFRNRYDTIVPGKGNLKVFAGSFTYRIEPVVPIVSFPDEGTATVKLFLDPDTGRWTIENWQKQDPGITLLNTPLEPSKAIASATEMEAKASIAREKETHEGEVAKEKAIQSFVNQLSGQWEGEWEMSGLRNPVATSKAQFNLDLQKNGSVLTGTYLERGARTNISGRVDGNQINFGFEFSDGSSRKYTGTVNSAGEVSGNWNQKNNSGTWKMVKNASSVEVRKATAPSSIATCGNITDCYNATLLAMTNRDIETVRSIAEKIDTFEKPPRGNRVVARKLNDEALSAMKKDDFAQAARIFAKAQREDPSDVEIASNLGTARVRAGDFVGANETLVAALQLNPRRTSTWVPIAELIARRDQNTNGAVSALLVAYEWSTAKEKAVSYYTAQSGTETHPQLRAAYEQALMRVPR